jgi:hypothetical protein
LTAFYLYKRFIAMSSSYKMRPLLLCVLIAWVVVPSKAATILADFQFTGNSLASADAGTNWTTTDLNSGGGVPLTFAGGEGNPTAPSIGFTMGDVNDGTFLDDDYYTFTITPDPGTELDFTSLTFDFQKQSGGADVNLRIFSSVDGFTNGSELGTGTVSPQGSWVTGISADLTSLANQTAATEFRIYVDTSGTFGPNALNLDNIQVEGEAIPEPSSLALLGLGLAFLIARRRR